jgi:TorA maturation chaperone TorD
MSDGDPMAGATVSFQPRIAPEDQARADIYALLARLYADAPDAVLLDAIARSEPLAAAPAAESATTAPCLPGTWDAVRMASAAMTADAAAEEYNALFVGVGKSEVNLHGSHWIAGFMMDKPLVALRETLARLGLAQKSGATMLEDHLSALCETMRLLIAGNAHRSPSTIWEQRAFFERHIGPWVFGCCDAIGGNAIANYYRRVAQLTACFMALERDSFAIE